MAISQLRETEPVGVLEQPRFLNGVVALDTDLDPRQLLAVLLEIERALGRVRDGVRHGPRTVDLDLLLYDTETIDEPDLSVPHPRLHERRFVLEPLADIDPRSRCPGTDRRRAARPARRLTPRNDSCGAGAPDAQIGLRTREAVGSTSTLYTGPMSHLDELDEFEAKLELELKREYTAVFGLFRYCILTQDATYLCNRLDLKVVPQANYPFFHVQMEDVWVWDKNRPTRMIPRAEVYTSGDVTVEELRDEGDEPKLTAEALAERLGESLPSDDEAV